MKLLFPTLFGYWLVLAPMLCLAGVTIHSCADCDVSVCSHEEECAEDPCPDLFVGATSTRGDSITLCSSEDAPKCGFDPHECVRAGCVADPAPVEFSSNLLAVDSDLPLLN